MTDLVSWTRFEPVTRDPSLQDGLAASIADPLWLLARQDALGEFAATDAGSPVVTRLRAQASLLTRLRPGSVGTGPGVVFTPGAGPLETLVEAEPEPDGESRPLFAAQAGLAYLRRITAAGAGDLTTYQAGLLSAYPFPAPAPAGGPSPGQPPPVDLTDDANAALRPYAGRVPDGQQLYLDLSSALSATDALPTRPSLGAANATAVATAARAWVAWYEAASGADLAPSSCWSADRMEYAFAVAAPGPGAETVFVSENDSTGELQWYHCDLAASSVQPAPTGTSLGAVAADLPGGDTAIDVSSFPTPASYRGMPNPRFWTFEDAAVNYGDVSAAAEDVTTSLIIEFALRYANDHYVVPIPLAVGSVLRVDSVVVTDTYGEVLVVRPITTVDGPDGSFRLFEHTVVPAAGTTAVRDPLFALLPTTAGASSGPPLEQVDYARDDLAEVVWAIENIALGAAGEPVDRAAAAAVAAAATPLPAPGPDPNTQTYVPRSLVLNNWFPFLAVAGPLSAATGASTTYLALADVPPLGDLAQPPPLPWGRIIGEQVGVSVPQEEITGAGLRITRAWRYARWSDGRQLSWVHRVTETGRGPASSGLKFDQAI
jgi:hypothetical protein